MRRKDRQVTDITKIESIIQKCEVCRLGMCGGKMPYVVPMNFGYDMDGESLTLYFHCAHEGKNLTFCVKIRSSALKWTADTR